MNQTKLSASFFVIVCSSRQTLTEKTIGYKLPILLTKDPFFRHPVRPPPTSCSLHKRRRPMTTTLPPLNPPWLINVTAFLRYRCTNLCYINNDGSYLFLLKLREILEIFLSLSQDCAFTLSSMRKLLRMSCLHFCFEKLKLSVQVYLIKVI